MASLERNNKVVLFNGHNHGLNGNLELVSEEITKRDQGCQIVAFSKQDLFHPNGGICSKIKGILCFFVKVPWNMADAGKIFLNDNLLPLAYMHTEGQQIIQLWHGAGAFKRFGLSTEEDPNVRKQVAEANKHVTHLFVTSTQIIPYYSEAFAIPTDRIYATGIPVLMKRTRKDEQRMYIVSIRSFVIKRYYCMHRRFGQRQRKMRNCWKNLTLQKSVRHLEMIGMFLLNFIRNFRQKILPCMNIA